MKAWNWYFWWIWQVERALIALNVVFAVSLRGNLRWIGGPQGGRYNSGLQRFSKSLSEKIWKRASRPFYWQQSLFYGWFQMNSDWLSGWKGGGFPKTSHRLWGMGGIWEGSPDLLQWLKRSNRGAEENCFIEPSGALDMVVDHRMRGVVIRRQSWEGGARMIRA